jgi:hypothetical protein
MFCETERIGSGSIKRRQEQSLHARFQRESTLADLFNIGQYKGPDRFRISGPYDFPPPGTLRGKLLDAR